MMFFCVRTGTRRTYLAQQQDRSTLQPPQLISIPEAMRQLSVGRGTIYKLINNRDLERVKIGRSSRILALSIAAYLERLKNA
jgi:excisionase family DNA binding protein